jgi:hypothetical protein
MIKQHARHLREKMAVVVGLAISLGMLGLTMAGWWMWKLLALVTQAPDVLPNGLVEVRYDRNGDGLPDCVTLHQVTVSGWTVQTISEIEAQATADGQWAFVVEYDRDRYVYQTRAESLVVGYGTQQNGRCAALPAASHGETVTQSCARCAMKGGDCNDERC